MRAWTSAVLPGSRRATRAGSNSIFQPEGAVPSSAMVPPRRCADPSGVRVTSPATVTLSRPNPCGSAGASMPTSADSARLVRARVDLGAEAGFALDRIAGKAAAATGTAATSDDWLKSLGFEASKSTRELLEGASCNAPDRSAVVAANVDKVELGMPDSAARTLRIALTLSHPDVPEPVVRARTVRIGANP